MNIPTWLTPKGLTDIFDVSVSKPIEQIYKLLNNNFGSVNVKLDEILGYWHSYIKTQGKMSLIPPGEGGIAGLRKKIDNQLIPKLDELLQRDITHVATERMLITMKQEILQEVRQCHCETQISEIKNSVIRDSGSTEIRNLKIDGSLQKIEDLLNKLPRSNEQKITEVIERLHERNLSSSKLDSEVERQIRESYDNIKSILQGTMVRGENLQRFLKTMNENLTEEIRKCPCSTQLDNIARAIEVIPQRIPKGSGSSSQATGGLNFSGFQPPPDRPDTRYDHNMTKIPSERISQKKRE